MSTTTSSPRYSSVMFGTQMQAKLLIELNSSTTSLCYRIAECCYESEGPVFESPWARTKKGWALYSAFLVFGLAVACRAGRTLFTEFCLMLKWNKII